MPADLLLRQSATSDAGRAVRASTADNRAVHAGHSRVPHTYTGTNTACTGTPTSAAHQQRREAVR